MSDLINNVTTSSTDVESQSIWRPRDASLLAIIAINTVVTLVCGCIVTVCIMRTLNKRSRNKEERDKLSNIIQDHYWQNEEKISKIVACPFENEAECHLSGSYRVTRFSVQV